jgi:hypothetical protein
VVLDAYSGKPVDGARITAGTVRAKSNGDGRFRIDPGSVSTITFEKAEYDSTQVDIFTRPQLVEIKLRPNVLRGTIVTRDGHKPISGVTVEATTAVGSVSPTKTDGQSAFTLASVPEGASLVISHASYATKTIVLGQHTGLDFSLRPDVVTDDQGEAGSGYRHSGRQFPDHERR